jgi:nucleoside phosphorylase
VHVPIHRASSAAPAVKNTNPASHNILARLRLATPLAAARSETPFQPTINHSPPLPPVNWGAISAQAPTLMATPAAAPPSAAAVVLVWTDAEWAALEHVFCNSGAAMPYTNRNHSAWTGWQKYDQGIPTVKDWTYWGEYRLVQIGTAPVLLFKSNTHLDFPGRKYLSQLISQLIVTVKPQLLLSTGTAGGARPGDSIGTVNVVRAGTLYESKQPQSSWPEYTSSWRAKWTVPGQSGFKKLLFPVPTLATDLASIHTQFNAFYKSDYSLNTLNVDGLDLAAALPSINNLTAGATSVLTADSFVVGTSSGNLADFACVEMDDAILAEVCAAGNVAFGSVRNISDPVQNVALPAEFQAHWGQAIYDAYGFYTSYNGAIAAWAILNGQFQ